MAQKKGFVDRGKCLFYFIVISVQVTEPHLVLGQSPTAHQCRCMAQIKGMQQETAVQSNADVSSKMMQILIQTRQFVF